MNTDLAQLFDDQHGVATSGQILALISRRAFAAELKTGALQRIWQGIYCRGEQDDSLRLCGLDLSCGTKVGSLPAAPWTNNRAGIFLSSSE